MRVERLGLAVYIGLLWFASRCVGAEQAVAIRYRPDPPPAVDGQLDEWQGKPPTFAFDRADQVTYGARAWKSTADLSGKVWLAWREKLLYLAADVVDDQHRQDQRGSQIYGGDSVQLFLDMSPDAEPTRTNFGPQQFQIALSPGNFRKTGDPLVDTRPEACCYKPEGRRAESVLVASRRTATGYTLEAAIPWEFLGVTSAAGLAIAVEAALSDTDAAEPRPDKWMTSSAARWSISRGRLMPAVLARADGTSPAPARPVKLFDSAKLQNGEKHVVKFSAAKAPPGRETLVALHARMDYSSPAGYAPAMQLRLNGVELGGDRLIGRPLRYADPQGRINLTTAHMTFNVHYALDFTSADKSFYAIPGYKACEFQLRVGDLLRDGQNELAITNVAGMGVKTPLVIADGALRFTSAVASTRRPKAGKPAGPLPVYRPGKTKTEYEVRELPDEAGLEVTVAGETFRVASRFSTPAGRWEHGSNRFFRHARRIERRDEAIVVRDTFENLTGENLPLMQRHQVKAAGKVKGIWVGGLSPSGLNAVSTDPGNPTVFAAAEKAGLGLLPVNDEFQVHVHMAAVEGELQLSDRDFVLRPKATYTAEWAVVPAARPDYFTFLNSARRLVGANFTIKLCFAFLRAGPLTEEWNDRKFADFIRLKSANVVSASNDYPTYKGNYTHGTAFQLVNHDNYRRWVERIRRLAPQAATQVYFHCFLDVLEDSPRKFADARVLRADGIQADYGESQYKIYFPLKDNSFGPQIAKNVDVILDEIRADGVYWDELEYSAYRYHYGSPWDGCSADIDQSSMKIARLKSSVTLLTQPWRVEMARKILARGPLVGNGQPHTRTMAALHFPRFVETGSPSNCALAQFHSPIALGDHLTERSELDAYRNMLSALDYGCLYHWYNDVTVIPTHTTLTEHMYPFTPLELQEGFVIGRERIITRKSGLFGWGDSSRHEVYVYDDSGREVPGYPAPQVTRDGANLTELRLAEDWSAVIVRKPER